MINQTWRGESRAVTWLGGIPSARYRVLYGCCAVLAALIVYGQCIMPALHGYRERADATQALKRYEDMRSVLLLKLRDKSKDASPLLGGVSRGKGAAEGKDQILETIHRIAGEAGVSIVTFMRSGVIGTSDSTGSSEYHLATRGGFAVHDQFLRSLSQDGVGIFVSSVLLENERWPEFDGQLRARLTLALAVTP